MLRADQLGAKGEARFSELCEDAQLACNKSNRDLTGWDFIVEFPFADNGKPPAPLESRTTPLSCHVQVKTILTKNDIVKLRLSSAERLAKETKPAFIVVLKVNDELEFVDLYFLHVLDDVLAKILKRLRKADAEKKSITNKMTISLSAGRDGKRIGVTGAALREAIANASGPDMHGYVQSKKEQLAKLGFEERPITMRAVLHLASNEEAVDMFLGLKTEVSASKLRTSQTRFGIELPMDPSESGEAKLTITPTAFDQCTIVARKEPLSKPAIFTGEIFLPAIPNLPKHLQKALIKTDLFSITMQRGNWSLTSTKETLLQTSSTWADYWRLYQMFATGEGALEITWGMKPFQIALPINQQVAEFNAARAKQWIGLCDQLSELLKYAGINSEPRFMLEDIDQCRNQIAAVHAWIFPANGNPQLTFVTGSKDALAQSAEVDVTVVDFFCLGEIALGYYGSARMLGVCDGDSMNWSASSVTLRRVTILRGFPDNFDQFVAEAHKATGIENSIVRFPTTIDADAPPDGDASQ